MPALKTLSRKADVLAHWSCDRGSQELGLPCPNRWRFYRQDHLVPGSVLRVTVDNTFRSCMGSRRSRRVLRQESRVPS